jgi:hypothetical protein
MDASDLIVTNLQKILQAGGRPHMGVEESATRPGPRQGARYFTVQRKQRRDGKLALKYTFYGIAL